MNDAHLAPPVGGMHLVKHVTCERLQRCESFAVNSWRYRRAAPLKRIHKQTGSTDEAQVHSIFEQVVDSLE